MGQAIEAHSSGFILGLAKDAVDVNYLCQSTDVCPVVTDVFLINVLVDVCYSSNLFPSFKLLTVHLNSRNKMMT